jgi:hypothetical protein
MAITMRMVARIIFFATEVTQGPLSSLHYTHIKHIPKSCCAICSGFEDTAKMSPRSRGTCPGDLADDPVSHVSCVMFTCSYGNFNNFTFGFRVRCSLVTVIVAYNAHTQQAGIIPNAS